MKKYFTGFAALLLSASLAACAPKEAETNQKQEDQVSTSKESKPLQEEKVTIKKSNRSKKSNSKNTEQTEDKSYSKDEISTVVSFAYPEKESQAEVKQVIYMSQEQPKMTYAQSSNQEEIKQVIAFSEPSRVNKTSTQEKQKIQESLDTSKRVLANIDNVKNKKEKGIDDQTTLSKGTIKEILPIKDQEDNSSSKLTKSEYQPIFAVNEPQIQTEIVAEPNTQIQPVESMNSKPNEQADVVLKPLPSENEESKEDNSANNDTEQIENDLVENPTKENVNANSEADVPESLIEKDKVKEVDNSPEIKPGDENSTLDQEEDKDSGAENESEVNTIEIDNSDDNSETAELQLMTKKETQNDPIESDDEEKTQESIDEREEITEERRSEVNRTEPKIAEVDTQIIINDPDEQLSNEFTDNNSDSETDEELEESIENNAEDKKIHLEIEITIKNDDQENTQIDSESRIENSDLEEIEVEIVENINEDSNSNDKEFLEV